MAATYEPHGNFFFWFQLFARLCSFVLCCKCGKNKLSAAMFFRSRMSIARLLKKILQTFFLEELKKQKIKVRVQPCASGSLAIATSVVSLAPVNIYELYMHICIRSICIYISISSLIVAILSIRISTKKHTKTQGGQV